MVAHLFEVWYNSNKEVTIMLKYRCLVLDHDDTVVKIMYWIATITVLRKCAVCAGILRPRSRKKNTVVGWNI